MAEINLSLVPKFVDNMLSPVAKEAGEALADLIRVARIPLSSYLKKNEVKLNAALNKLKKELENIPDENVVPPKSATIGPALEDLFKYCLEEEHIVEAFSKLIAASMDKEKTSAVHPHLFFAVKQMTAMDSKVFKSIFTNSCLKEIYAVQPYAVFYMSGMPFPRYYHYDIVLLESGIFENDAIEYLIKAFDSVKYLENLGLITKISDKKYNTTSQRYLESEIRTRLEMLMKKVEEETISSIDLRKEIIVYRWGLTNLGRYLAKILGLSDDEEENIYATVKKAKSKM